MQNSLGQCQTKADPSVGAVHIQIYNPTTGGPNTAYNNINPTQYGQNPFGTTNCYPSNYYLNQWGQGCTTPQYYPQPGAYPNVIPGMPQQNAYPNATPGMPQSGTYPNAAPGMQQPNAYPNAAPGMTQPTSTAQGGAVPQNTFDQHGQTVNGPQVNGGQTININNPQAPSANAQPSQGESTNVNANETTPITFPTENSNKKTEKRTIVLLTDDYIKNVENYLNSQDKEVRLMGAKEVAARAMEDPSRKNDKALNALVNKMIQDPDQKVRFLGLSLLYSRTLTGDDYTVSVLQNMQNSTSGYGQDALLAANILLKMSGQAVEKEFEVTDKDSKKKKTEDINKVMTLL